MAHPGPTPSELKRSPEVTNPPLIAMKCKEGILIASNSAGFYGAYAKYLNIPRFTKISNNIVFGRLMSFER